MATLWYYHNYFKYFEQGTRFNCYILRVVFNIFLSKAAHLSKQHYTVLHWQGHDGTDGRQSHGTWKFQSSPRSKWRQHLTLSLSNYRYQFESNNCYLLIISIGMQIDQWNWLVFNNFIEFKNILYYEQRTGECNQAGRYSHDNHFMLEFSECIVLVRNY